MESLAPTPNRSATTITEFFRGRSVFITGGSGFIGKVLIEKLLRSSPGIGKIYILLREKKGKTPRERVKTITDQPLFKLIKEQNPSVLEKIVPISGDACKIGLGLSEEDRNTIIENVSVIFNIAASVRFDEPLKNAIIQNVRSVREVIGLAEKMHNIAVFVHVSTAYANCDKKVIEERFYPPHVGWREAIEIAEKGDDFSSQILTEKYIRPLPNTYTFTKSLAEHVVRDLCLGKVPAIVVRPSIVMSAIAEPLPGWVDNFNGPFAMFIATGAGFSRVLYGRGDQPLDHVSVDNFVKSLIIAAWEKALTSRETTDIPIYNSCSEIKMSVDTYLALGYRGVRKYPFEKKVWAICKNPPVLESAKLYFLLTVLLQVLPAILLDGAIRLCNGKPMALNIQRKIYIGNTALHYFMSKSIHFRCENYNKLPNKLLEEDKQQFKLISVDLVTYSENLVRGLKEFLLKESPDVSQRTVFIDNCWLTLDLVTKCTSCALASYFLFCKCSFAFDLLERLYLLG